MLTGTALEVVFPLPLPIPQPKFWVCETHDGKEILCTSVLLHDTEKVNTLNDF